jgi:hypothetical protein
MKYLNKDMEFVHKQIKEIMIDLNHQVEAMPRQYSGVPEMNVKIVQNFDKIRALLLAYSNLHADWRAR